MIKVLKYMNIHYSDFFSTNSSVKIKYREKSNVLSYYIITNILIFHYQPFLSWCFNNNGSIDKIMNFKKDIESQKKMCLFVRQHYKTQFFFDSIFCMEKTMLELKDLNYSIKNNLRMTICELE
jgi:hypothetical protein